MRSFQLPALGHTDGWWPEGTDDFQDDYRLSKLSQATNNCACLFVSLVCDCLLIQSTLALPRIRVVCIVSKRNTFLLPPLDFYTTFSPTWMGVKKADDGVKERISEQLQERRPKRGSTLKGEESHQLTKKTLANEKEKSWECCKAEEATKHKKKRTIQVVTSGTKRDEEKRLGQG